MSYLENFNSMTTRFQHQGTPTDIVYDYTPPGYLRISKLTKGWGKGLIENVPRLLKPGMVFANSFTFRTNTVGNPGSSDDNSSTQIGLFLTSVPDQPDSPLVWGLHVHGGIMKLSNGDTTIAEYVAPTLDHEYLLTEIIKHDNSIDFFLTGLGSPGFLGNIPVADLSTHYGRWKLSPYFTDVIDVNTMLYIGA